MALLEATPHGVLPACGQLRSLRLSRLQLVTPIIASSSLCALWLNECECLTSPRVACPRLHTLELTGSDKLIDPAIASDSLTRLDLSDNKLGVEGWTIIFNALRDSTVSKITKWDLSSQGINPTIAKSLAAYAAINSSLTKVRAAAIPLLYMSLSACCCLHSSMLCGTYGATRAWPP